MIQSVTAKYARDNFSDLLAQVEHGKKEFIITRFGKPGVKLVPVDGFGDDISGITETSQMWADRKDIQNSADWVTSVRQKWSERNQHE